MLHAILDLNYIAVVVTAIIGFLLGWLWFSPVLFAKPWMAEMKFTKETMEASKPNMPLLFAKGFLFTLLGTFGLAVLMNVKKFGFENWLKGAEMGAFVGVFVVGVRLLNGALWEQRSCKLQAITAGHEVVLYAVQGAILAVWN
jgi:ABC-type uncharacterized transport system permease subunit